MCFKLQRKLLETDDLQIFLVFHYFKVNYITDQLKGWAHNQSMSKFGLLRTTCTGFERTTVNYHCQYSCSFQIFFLVLPALQLVQLIK